MRKTSQRRRSELVGGKAFTAPAQAPAPDRRESIEMSGSDLGKVFLTCPDCQGQVSLKKANHHEGETWPLNPNVPHVKRGDTIYRKHRPGGGRFSPARDTVICPGYGRLVEG